MKLYEYMQYIREESGLSQVDFADKIGVSKSYLCDVEMDRRSISIKKAIIISDRLKLSSMKFIELILQDHLNKEGLEYVINLSKISTPADCHHI